MKIFVGFGYNANDVWIKDLVFPIIKAFDAIVVTGEDLHGKIISQEVVDRIRKSDGMFAFLTRRDAIIDGKFTSHRWVYDELSTAISNNIPLVEIRDNKVDDQGGLPGDRQRVEFDLDNKAELIVELVEILADWKRKIIPRRMVILPKEIVQEARPYISNNTLTCTYKFMDGSKQSQEYNTTPFRFGQGLCVDVCNVPSEEALIQITLKGPQFSWTSDYESVKLLPINLQKD
jgi:hypothetical protein